MARFLTRHDGIALAYRHMPGTSPGVVYLPGFMSEMSGGKAVALERWCREAGRQFTRFDYSGVGESTGEFADGTISAWAADAEAILDEVATGPQVLVGASMGGWIAALLAARRGPERVVGVVGVAAAPDFVERWWATLSEEAREELRATGRHYRSSAYSDEPYLLTMRLLEDGRQHLVLGGPLLANCPVRLLHGMRDLDVPWGDSVRLAEMVCHGNVLVELIKDGDHRLSRPMDIARLIAAVGGLCFVKEASSM
mmetsp:Transcript_100712/g.291108  ORF Transcript_100712/g.291108 Transcript_100712/m.291108 type:complete len:254 (+) Transcript_100712:74-835(+)|eukprot:CAMPEP_0176023998 /NCGR_PEP_ID=MMETSP0120_2-20121206/11718_1 /TAXON_ID=160619 /ORGANISM="Kryptoperidinium foliaceum, Strain CCMP 1326" /LENGTH=253 /DNA_ID=CAMNT_0017357169 /DNA_START=35 /DNA_END=796 /DNA_ORIENTATION=-